MRGSFATPVAVCALFAAPVVLLGCGGSKDYANEPRPAAPINVTAAITDKSVEVSPQTFGAGPVVLIISNQTSRSHKVTLETSDTTKQAGMRQRSTDPIDPSGTGQLKANVVQGEYELSVDGGSIDAASIKVSKARPSAQNDLLQP